MLNIKLMTTHLNLDDLSGEENNNNDDVEDPWCKLIDELPTEINTVSQVIKAFIQIQLLNKIQTGNRFIDIIILSLVPSGLNYVEHYLIILKNYVMWILWFISGGLIKLFTKEQIKTFDKVAEIDYITDNKQINELYKAVHWYLSNSEEIDFINESPLKFTFEKKITSDSVKKMGEETLNKYLAKNKEKTIEYNKHKIIYSMSDHLINVYTDKERKRENYRITLKVIMNEKATNDILEDFCNHCLTEYMKNMTSSIWVQQIFVNENDKWKSSPSKNRRKIDTIVLKNNLKEEIKKDLQLFLNSEEWYHHRDIPYTRGYLFYGVPGTGKTSLIKGISNMCKRHIHFLMLSQVKNDAQLLELFKNIDYKETILVIEDIDCMTEIIQSRDMKEDILKKLKKELNDEEYKNKNTSKDNPSYKSNEYVHQNQDHNQNNNHNHNNNQLTLSGVLNAIDGVFNNEGRILIMTTNHPEVLDEALIRAGRVDRKFLFDHCNHQQIEQLYEMFFNKLCPKHLLENIHDRTYSPAHITSLFMRFRDNPEESLLHLDEIEDPSIIKN